MQRMRVKTSVHAAARRDMTRPDPIVSRVASGRWTTVGVQTDANSAGPDCTLGTTYRHVPIRGVHFLLWCRRPLETRAKNAGFYYHVSLLDQTCASVT